MDMQRAAHAAARDAVHDIEQHRYPGDHGRAGRDACQLGGGKPVRIAVKIHDHHVKRPDQAGADNGGHEEHAADLPAHRAEQVGVRRAEVAQVVVHAGVYQRDGHAAGERDDDDRGEAHNGDKNEQHEEHGHRGHKVVLVKDAELRHVLPVATKAGGVAVVVVDGFQPAGRRGLGENS